MVIVDKSAGRDTLLILSVSFFSFVFASGFIWMRIDQSVWPFDPAWYGEVSLKLFRLFRNNPSEWWSAMMHAFGFKAPLIAWVGQFFVPLQKLLGSYENALGILPLLCSAFSVVFVIIAAYRLFDCRTFPAIVAGLTMTAASLFMGLSREYFVEPLQLLTVGVIFFLLTSSLGGWSLLLIYVCVVSLGMLCKVSTPLYIVFPTIVIFFDIISHIREKTSKRNILLLALPALSLLVLCLTWYSVNWSNLYNFLRSTSGGETAELYGHRGQFIPKLDFWIEMLGISFFNCKSGALIWLALLFLSSLVRISRGITMSRKDLIIMCAGAQVVLVLCVFAFQINEESRYLLPLLPAVALASSFIVEEIKFLAIISIFWLFAQSTIILFVSTSGYPPYFSFSSWLHQANPNDEQRRILHEVISDTCYKENNGRYIIIGHEVSEFNANSAAFYMAQETAGNRERESCYYTSLGYAEKDDQRSWDRIHQLNADFIVFREDLRSASNDPFNAVSELIRKRVSTSSEFIKIDKTEFPVLQLYKRTP